MRTAVFGTRTVGLRGASSTLAAALAEAVAVSSSARRNVTLTPMLGRILGSSALKPMRTSTVAFCRSAVGTTVMTWAGIDQSGVCIEHRGDVLTRRHAVDVRLIDIDFDFKGVHVDDRADTRPREPAACGDWRHHLPGCASLGNRDAAEWRTNDRVIEIGLLHGSLTLGDSHLLARRGDTRAERIDLGLRLIDIRLCGDAFFDELLPTAECEPRLAEPNLVLSHVATGRFDLRFSEHQCRPHVGVVEPREHLALL